MTTVVHLIPGQQVTRRNAVRTYIAQTPHPLDSRLQLVFWCDDEGYWSLEALAPGHDVGPVRQDTDADRRRRLREALSDKVPAHANGSRR